MNDHSNFYCYNLLKNKKSLVIDHYFIHFVAYVWFNSSGRQIPRKYIDEVKCGLRYSLVEKDDGVECVVIKDQW